MKHCLTGLVLTLFAGFCVGQPKTATSVPPPLQGTDLQVTVTQGKVTQGAKVIDYEALAGYLDLKNDTGKVLAKIFFTYYRKKGVTDKARPITFAFNGGPGSSSVWLHMGALGPRRILLKDDGTAPPPPYQYINNEYTWLDKTDLVFIDPVSTGFSRPVPKENPKQFHGYQEDIQSVGSFIRYFLTKYERWGSAKFLAGESYGSTRAAGLSQFLQEQYRIYLNGVFLISAVLNFGTLDYAVGNDLPLATMFPSFTATAWYHKKLAPELQADFGKTLKQSEEFALNEYIPGLVKGDWLSPSEQEKLAERLAYFSGLSKEFWLAANLRVNDDRFYKQLLRKEGLTVGRFDSRFTGRDRDDAGEFAGYDPSGSNFFGVFSATVNDYLQTELKVKEEKPYQILINVFPWNYGPAQNQYLNVADGLRDAMFKNPALKVFVASGIYDLATPYFQARYDVAHMLLRPEARKNIRHGFYQSGHMFYINKPDLVQFKKDVDAFYDWALQP